MPYYLDFDSTKRLRDELLKRTLDPVYGKDISPKTFNSSTYSVQNLSNYSNVLLPNVDSTRENDLKSISTSNTYKPNTFEVKDTLIDLPRRANLNLYPYFVKSDENLISIMSSATYDNESELFKFAAKYIKKDPNGPVLSRIQQNLYTATTAKNKIGEALGGNLTTLQAIIRGKQPLIEGNNKITVSSSLLGKGIDFLGTVAGTQLPWSTIPGDYLSNPRNPINVRPTNVSTATKVWQDLTGVLGSIVGIERRPLPTRKPSDLLIEHMGNASKSRLFDLLSYSKYGPNYTTTARSQQSTKLFNFPNLVAESIKSVLGFEAPDSNAYIGDDRANDVRLAMTDLISGRPVRSSYYLTLMFDKTAAELFHSDRNTINQGKLEGKLTWISSKTINKYNQAIQDSLSTKFKFREDSILFTTQDMLDSSPISGGDKLSHISHVLDQTSRYFKDGDTYISRGSAVKYMKNGKDAGIEYARVWTKDKPYHLYKHTAPYENDITTPYYSGATGNYYRRGNIRRFDGSVLNNTWNLNITPNSIDNKTFDQSTSIGKKGNQFYAKKYMFSLENLAWKNTHLPGFSINDLPYSERGPNGGRIMWFPPYDVKVNEVSSATWEKNNFLGRPEPIYTYQNTERSGTLSFKILVDHPSILNLLVREHFKLMNDEQADNYISSFFAGAKDIDFYSLIRTYTNLDNDDITNIQNYLNSNGDSTIIKNQVDNLTSVNVTPAQVNNADKQTIKVQLEFNNDVPGIGANTSISKYNYQNLNTILSNDKINIVSLYTTALTSIVTNTDAKAIEDRKTIFNNTGATLNNVVVETTNLASRLNNSLANFDKLDAYVHKLASNIDNKKVDKNIIVNVGSTAAKTADESTEYNYLLTIRRSNSIAQYIVKSLIKNNFTTEDKIIEKYWNFKEVSSVLPSGYEKYEIDIQVPLSELGYTDNKNFLIIKTLNYGEKNAVNGYDCSTIKINDNDIKRYSPLMYGCRTSTVSIDYATVDTKPVPQDSTKPPTKLLVNNVQTQNNKPPIDVMKRIVMKALSEQYYFKKVEEETPLVFNSIKEKLKYFHPAFHSMTPEGLNSRLTFLQQCLRPGDTIPTKGNGDNSDIVARNTTFGPPPICILRFGDFYHSKVVIRDLNLNFDESTWDLNPEGIGIQPMIANVTLQLNFIGGQGLEAPVERLQNALSSNFYGNTEMYDERSISTATSIGGKTGNTFTKAFLRSLNEKNKLNNEVKFSKNEDGKSKYIQGEYLGVVSGNSLNYTPLIENIYKDTASYFESYTKMYNDILTKYGQHLTNMMINKIYRNNTELVVYNDTAASTLKLFGYIKKSEYSNLVQLTKKQLIDYITVDKVSVLLKYDNIDPNIKDLLNQNLHDVIKPILNSKFNEIESYSFSINSVRNDMIKNIDKLNYVVVNASDFAIDGASTSGVTLSGFTAIDFYKGYKDCVDYINAKESKMYESLNTGVTFGTSTSPFDDDIVRDILGVLLKDDINKLNSVVNDTMSVEIYEPYAPIIIAGYTEFFYKPEEVKFKFGRAPIRKNSQKFSYVASTPSLISRTDDMTKLFLRINEPEGNLNFLRNE